MEERVTAEKIAFLYEQAGYGKAADYLVDNNFLENLYPKGVFGFFVFSPEQELLGMARVFSDNYICSWIAELCVKPGAGDPIAASLLKAIDKQFGHTSLYVEDYAYVIDRYKSIGIIPRDILVSASRKADPARKREENNPNFTEMTLNA